MAPFYKVAKMMSGLGKSLTFQGWDPNMKLDKDDVKAIQALYGEKVDRPSPTVGYQDKATRWRKHRHCMNGVTVTERLIDQHMLM